jgi:GntR family transcriptional regulator
MSYIRYDCTPDRGLTSCTHLLPMNTQSTPPELAASSENTASAPAFSPLYQQIKGLILQSLQAAEWKPGESIPSEMDLAATGSARVLCAKPLTSSLARTC